MLRVMVAVWYILRLLYRHTRLSKYLKRNETKQKAEILNYYHLNVFCLWFHEIVFLFRSEFILSKNTALSSRSMYAHQPSNGEWVANNAQEVGPCYSFNKEAPLNNCF